MILNSRLGVAKTQFEGFIIQSNIKDATLATIRIKSNQAAKVTIMIFYYQATHANHETHQMGESLLTISQ